MLHLVVGDESFEPADGDRGIAFAADAGCLTLDFLWADPARYGGEVVVFSDEFSGGEEISFGDEFDKAGYVDTDGAAGDADGFFALEAALCLADGDLFGKAEVDFLEVLVALEAGALWHLLARYGESFFWR